MRVNGDMRKWMRKLPLLFTNKYGYRKHSGLRKSIFFFFFFCFFFFFFVLFKSLFSVTRISSALKMSNYIITKTRLYNSDPHEPQFYVVKLWFIVGKPDFFISALNYRLWILDEAVLTCAHHENTPI